MSTLAQTLEISGISIVLLFAAMAVIWGLMALMARIPDKSMKAETEEEEPAEAPAAAEVPSPSLEGKARAAVAAVATALALYKISPRPAAKAAGSATTSWQAAQRANQISRRNQIISRK